MNKIKHNNNKKELQKPDFDSLFERYCALPTTEDLAGFLNKSEQDLEIYREAEWHMIVSMQELCQFLDGEKTAEFELKTEEFENHLQWAERVFSYETTPLSSEQRLALKKMISINVQKELDQFPLKDYQNQAGALEL